MIYLLLGIIIGLLLNPIKQKVFNREGLESFIKKNGISKEIEKTQFFEPLTDKEKYQSAKNIDDLLDN